MLKVPQNGGFRGLVQDDRHFSNTLSMTLFSLHTPVPCCYKRSGQACRANTSVKNRSYLNGIGWQWVGGGSLAFFLRIVHRFLEAELTLMTVDMDGVPFAKGLL
jgi:hypothetical protein